MFPRKRRSAAPKAAPAQPAIEQVTLPTYPSIGAWVQAGIDVSLKEDREKTRDEAGRLRGGSIGCDLADGRYTGTCKRAALARYLGAQAPYATAKRRSTQLMFDGGHANEDAFIGKLVKGMPPGYTILREEEFPIEWQVQGVKATGREDIIILDPTGKPVCLVELKCVSSLPHELLFGEAPKMDNLIQAGNYTYRTGIPVQLWYSSRVIHSLPDWPWVQALVPNERDAGAPGRPFVEYARSGKATKVIPFMLGFHVVWHEGYLYYTKASLDPDAKAPTRWVRTPLPQAGLDTYYAGVLEQLSTQTLAAPPVPMDTAGKAKYKACDYCDWNNICKATGDDFRSWREAVQAQIPPKK